MGGQDKGLVMLNGRPLITYVLAALRLQVDTILINANRNLDRYSKLGYPVIGDRHADFSGPLAGMASALRVINTRLLVTVPCDCPSLPADLVSRLDSAWARDAAELAVVHDGTRLQPLFALLERGLLDSLERYLARGQHSVQQWYACHRTTLVDFSDQPQAFSNVNTPGDLARVAPTGDGATSG
jgi:molybdopterin-guanine dinucleotide biosynthesis protein A